MKIESNKRSGCLMEPLNILVAYLKTSEEVRAGINGKSITWHMSKFNDCSQKVVKRLFCKVSSNICIIG